MPYPAPLSTWPTCTSGSLRLDVAKDGSVLKHELGAVGDAANQSSINAYGAKLYVAALALAAAEFEVPA